LEVYVARQVKLLQQSSDPSKVNASPVTSVAADWGMASALANQIHTSADAIADSESEALKFHSETVKIKTRQSSIAFLFLATLTALFIGLAFYQFSPPYAERRRAIEQLRHSEERYRLLAENSLDLVALLDLKGNLTHRHPI
jgi:PAS domain-containing protein